MNMRILTSFVSAAALMGTISVASAATMTGDITGMNMNRHTLTLNGGSTVFVPDSRQLSALRPGQKVTVAYSERGNEKQANKITPMGAPANNTGHNADLGG
jgi:hypothetical protein